MNTNYLGVWSYVSHILGKKDLASVTHTLALLWGCPWRLHRNYRYLLTGATCFQHVSLLPHCFPIQGVVFTYKALRGVGCWYLLDHPMLHISAGHLRSDGDRRFGVPTLGEASLASLGPHIKGSFQSLLPDSGLPSLERTAWLHLWASWGVQQHLSCQMDF